nr:MAG TPA: Serine/Threonine protein kinase [Caudoviricetes sp.]
MKLKKEALQLINACLQVDFFRESTIPELKEALPEMADSIYEVAKKWMSFSN